MANDLVTTTILPDSQELQRQNFMPLLSTDMATKRYGELVSFVKKVMRENIDFGKIPGTQKATLLKAGAEKLATMFGFRVIFVPVTVKEDWRGKDNDGDPFFHYHYKCQLWRGDNLIAEADGSCNSFESRYRWRWVQESDVPADKDKDKMVKKGGKISEFAFAIEQAQTSGQYGKPMEYWQRFRDAISNGTARSLKKKTKKGGEMDAFEIDSTLYRVPNEDIPSQANTMMKIAQKRCLASTVPLFIKSDRRMSRSDVGSLYETLQKAKKPLYVPGIDGTWRKVNGMVRFEDKDIWKIELGDGSFVRATQEHRFPTTSGLKEVSQLSVGDSLLRSAIVNDAENGALPEIGWIVGLFISEGHFSTPTCASFTINIDEPSFVQRIEPIAKMVGATISASRRNETNTLDVDVYGQSFCGIIKQFIDGGKSYGKHLSKHAWSQGKEFLKAVLDGYLDGDGSFTERPGTNAYWRIGFTGKNYELANDLRTLCAILGYRISLKRSNARLKGVDFPTFTGWIKNPADTYNQKDLNAIVSITKEGKTGPVFDIEVDGDHIFLLANGIQTHNSLVAAILIGCNASEFFTQDIEDMDDHPERSHQSYDYPPDDRAPWDDGPAPMNAPPVAQPAKTQTQPAQSASADLKDTFIRNLANCKTKDQVDQQSKLVTAAVRKKMTREDQLQLSEAFAKRRAEIMAGQTTPAPAQTEPKSPEQLPPSDTNGNGDSNAANEEILY